MNTVFIFVIRVYQLIFSPVAATLGAQCRFYPSCSEYAAEAFENFPWWKAAILTGKRLLKCGPWHEGGMDKI